MKQLCFTSLLLSLPLIFILSGCSDDDTSDPEILEPIANFTYDISNEGVLPTLVSFTSTSKNATSFQWDFGDGGTSSEQNPEHSYEEAGTYQVQLTVSNAGVSDSTSQAITVSPPAIVAIPQVDDVVTNFMNTYAVPGMSVAITKDGKLVYAKSYGFADQDASEAVSNSSLFRIASVSKPITGVAIMKLLEEGELTLDQKVFGEGAILGTTYGSLPYSTGITDITVSHLLHHTAGGWGNSSNDPMFSNPTMSQDELISWTLNNRPLVQTPGNTYDYSNFGYCILGRVIEKITGESYEQWVLENVLQPAGITDMVISGNTLADRKESEVVYYGQGGEDPYAYNITRMDAHGGWLATATDLARFLVSVDGFSTKPDILEAATINVLTTTSTANPNYACGWAVNSANNWWHTGSLPGTASEIVRSSGGYSWVLLCNTRSTSNNYNADLDNLIWQAVNDPTTQWPDMDLF